MKYNEGLPIFAKVLGKDWEKLSPFMKKRFGNRPYSHDVLSVDGMMTIKASRWMRLIKPLLKLSGALIQQEGENVPTTVTFRSEPTSARYYFEREFKFPHHPERFKSYMVNVKDNIMVEFMRFNMGWRTQFSVENGSVVMSHHGFVFRFFNILIPTPISLLIGKCHAVERQVSDDSFSMEMTLTHFYFGKIYEYRGIFKLIQV